MAAKKATKRDKKKLYNGLQVKLINGYVRNMEDSLYGTMPIHLIDICMEYYEPIYFMSTNEETISIGSNIKVTYYQQRLEYYWKECELGNIGEKYMKQYLNKIGKITQMADLVNNGHMFVPVAQIETVFRKTLEYTLHHTLIIEAGTDQMHSSCISRYIDIVFIMCNGYKRVAVIYEFCQIDEDDETIEVRWGNFLTAWIPIKACCMASKNDEPSIFADFASIGRVM